MRFAQQPALNYKGSLASPGYSYEFFGGDCTYCIFPHEVMELGALMPYDGESFFEASLGEPMSCIIGATTPTTTRTNIITTTPWAPKKAATSSSSALRPHGPGRHQLRHQL